MKSTLAAATLALAAALTLAACHHAAPNAAPNAAPGSAGWVLQLTSAPTPPSSNGDTTFSLRVTDAKGMPINDAGVGMDIVMTTMDMGANHVALSPAGGGIYTGKGSFGMEGPWRCDVTVTAQGKTQKQSFPEQVQ